MRLDVEVLTGVGSLFAKALLSHPKSLQPELKDLKFTMLLGIWSCPLALIQQYSPSQHPPGPTGGSEMMTSSKLKMTNLNLSV